MTSLKAKIPVVILVAAVLIYLARMSTDHTPEFRAALYSGDAPKIEALLKAHPSLANANNMEPADGSKRADGWTPLHVAASGGSAKLINLLVRYHAEVNVLDKRGLTPLLWTASAGHSDAAAALLSNGADVNARGPDGHSALDLAKLSQDTNMIKLLRDNGARE